MSTLSSKRVPASQIQHFLQAERNSPELKAFQQEFKFARHIDQIDIAVVLKRRISKHPKFSQLWSFSNKIPVPDYCKSDLQIVSWFARGLARICFALGFTEDQTRELLWSWLVDQQPNGFDPDPEIQSQQIENLITFDWIQYGLNMTDQLRTKYAQKKTDKKEQVKQERKATGKMKLSEKVLEHLAAHHGSTPTQIADALSKPVETMNVTLHRMVKKQQIGKTGYGSYCLAGERQPVPAEVVEVPEAVKQQRTLASNIPPEIDQLDIPQDVKYRLMRRVDEFLEYWWGDCTPNFQLDSSEVAYSAYCGRGIAFMCLTSKLLPALTKGVLKQWIEAVNPPGIHSDGDDESYTVRADDFFIECCMTEPLAKTRELRIQFGQDVDAIKPMPVRKDKTKFVLASDADGFLSDESCIAFDRAEAAEEGWEHRAAVLEWSECESAPEWGERNAEGAY